MNRVEDDADTASPFRPIASRSDNYLNPGGRLQLPPIVNKSVSKLRSSSSFGDLASVGEKQREKPKLKKSNALIVNDFPAPKQKELRSLSIAVPPHSFDSINYLVSPSPTHKHFRHTDSIQRYDDEVTCK